MSCIPSKIRARCWRTQSITIEERIPGGDRDNLDDVRAGGILECQQILGRVCEKIRKWTWSVNRPPSDWFASACGDRLNVTNIDGIVGWPRFRSIRHEEHITKELRGPTARSAWPRESRVGRTVPRVLHTLLVCLQTFQPFCDRKPHGWPVH